SARTHAANPSGRESSTHRFLTCPFAPKRFRTSIQTAGQGRCFRCIALKAYEVASPAAGLGPRGLLRRLRLGLLPTPSTTATLSEDETDTLGGAAFRPVGFLPRWRFLPLRRASPSSNSVSLNGCLISSTPILRSNWRNRHS